MIKSRRLRWTGLVARVEDDRNALKILTYKSTRKRPLGRPRWEDDVRVDLKQIGINTRNWVDSAQDRDYCRNPVNTELNLRVPEVMGLVN